LNQLAANNSSKFSSSSNLVSSFGQQAAMPSSF
jgi:hypothetical protein